MRARRLEELTCLPSRVHAETPRHCRLCGARLSRYNPDPVCACHRIDTPFDIDAFIDAAPWPGYLPDPREPLGVYTVEELAVLRALAHHAHAWVHLNYVLTEGGRQVINNTIRKLRRKGFTIEGRRSGGYLLRDRIPPLE